MADGVDREPGELEPPDVARRPSPRIPLEPDALIADRLELGEGARWFDGALYLVDILTGRLLIARHDGGARLETVLRLDTSLGAAAAIQDRPGQWLVAAGRGFAVTDSRGSVEWLARPEDGNPASVRMNDGAVDGRGRFWAGSMAEDGQTGAGSLYRVEHDGTVHRVLDGITISNGPAFSPDGALMYLADSAAGTVDRFSLDAVGDIVARDLFVRFEGDTVSPDGMAVDVEGYLWLAMWGGGCVHRYRPDGALAQVVRVAATQPTSVCLGGADGRRLFITSAYAGLAQASSTDGALFTMRVDVAGPPSSKAILR